MLLESAQLDLEFSKKLLPSPTRSDIIAKHLSAIRAQFPKMKDVKHARKWMAGRLIISDCKKTIDECIELITATEYGPVDQWTTTPLKSTDSFLLSFEKPYNPETLAATITNLCECTCSVEQSSFSGTNNGNIEINVFGEYDASYTFSIILEKSTAACMYKHFWKYSVTGQVLNFIVHLENEWERDLIMNKT